MKFPGKMNFVLISIVLLLFSTVIVYSTDGLPGADAPEGFPNGCIDCHSASDNGDFRLNTTLGRNENHPSVTKTINNVPDDCMMCHGKDSYGGEMKGLIHKNHLENDTYTNAYGSDCMSCHSDFPKDGNPFMKVGPKNW